MDFGWAQQGCVITFVMMVSPQISFVVYQAGIIVSMQCL
jgi:uncharacterized membrane protein